MIPIYEKYLLAINIPIYKFEGILYLDDLWYKDLKEHLKYIKNLTLLCPIVKVDKLNNNFVKITNEDYKKINIVTLPEIGTMGSVFVNFLKILRICWVEVGKNELIHSALAGWPLPIGWIVYPISWIKRKKSIVYIESAFWRNITQCNKVKNIVKRHIFENINKYIVNKSDLKIFTSEGYAKDLSNSRKKSYVINASWINSENIITSNQLDSKWDLSIEKNIIRLLYVGRLSEEKGVEFLLKTISTYPLKKNKITIDFIGDGNLKFKILEMQENLSTPVKIKYLEPISYDDNFFRFLDNYHIVIVPTISDEQPRIIYDAFSRGCLVLASDTSGNKSVINDRENGVLFKTLDENDFIKNLNWILDSHMDVKTIVKNALNKAHHCTHAEAHKERNHILIKEFNLNEKNTLFMQ